MVFCPKCGGILKLTKQPGVLECSKCKTKVKLKAAKISSNVIKKEKREGVLEETNVLPKTKERCPKCGNNEAYYWLQQTRAADEAATKFLRCTKCGYTWRDYS